MTLRITGFCNTTIILDIACARGVFSIGVNDVMGAIYITFLGDSYFFNVL
jgi:hypothetical protein